MKSLLLAAFAVAAPLYSFAQFSKGDKVVEGAISVYIYRTPISEVDNYESRSSSLSVYPHIGFFINKHTSIGGGVGYQSSMYRAYQPGNIDYLSESRGTNLQVTVRRYASIADAFLFSLSSYASYSAGNFTQSSSTDKVKYKSAGISVGPSFHFFPTRNWAVEGGIGSIGYSRSIQKDIDRKSNSFHLSLGTFSFGLAYYFRQ